MRLSEEQVIGLNTACNEAQWIGLDINHDPAWAAITLSVLSLPEEGPVAADSRVVIVFEPLIRIVASHRSGLWNDEKAEIIPLTVEQLMRKIVECQQPIYGWEFFNIDDEEGFERWADRLSIDLQLSGTVPENTINLFQDIDPFLEVRIWFGNLRILGPDLAEIPLQTFVEGGRRWWDGLHVCDPRTMGAGIVPLKDGMNSY
jgi:hypothetical protein